MARLKPSVSLSCVRSLILLGFGMSLHNTIASIALILGLGAAIIGSPTRGNHRLSAITRLIESEQDHITSIELAVNLMEGRKQIRIIDLRDSVSFLRYHIPGAELMSLTTLLNGGIKRNEHIVIYSQGGTHASQAWVLLKTIQFDSVLTLLGGMGSWENEVLFPVLNSDTVGSRMFEQKKASSLYFGGTPQIISSTQKKKLQRRKVLPPQQSQPPLRKEEEKMRYVC
jgi:rhodanese-related sulfurtransferase